MRFYCPECGAEIDVTPQHGDEVVSVYCIKHTSGVDGRRHPVYMTRVAVAVTDSEAAPEPVLAATGASR